MRHVTSDDCRTCADAVHLLYRAKLHLHCNAPKAAIPPYRRSYYEAIKLLTQVQRGVLEQGNAEAQDSNSAGRRAFIRQTCVT